MDSLKYLDKYKEEEGKVVFYLKDFPSCRSSGNKIAKELYLHFFDEATIFLERVRKIDDLIYEVDLEQYFCINCNSPIFFEEDSNYITSCDNCSWRNELSDTPAIKPITLKIENHGDPLSEDYYKQICYPLIEDADISHLPDGLKGAIITFLKTGVITKNQRDNIRANLINKSSEKFREIATRYEQKAKLSEFFKTTNF